MIDDVALWNAVIEQALVDACGTPPLERQQARAWLTYPNKDFTQVCALAGQDAELIREYAQKIIVAHDATPAKFPLDKVYFHKGKAERISVHAEAAGVPLAVLKRRLNSDAKMTTAQLLAPLLPAQPKAAPLSALHSPIMRPRVRSHRASRPRIAGRTGRTPALHNFDGRIATLAEHAKAAGLPINLVYMRLFKQWPLERALTTPPNKTKPRRYDREARGSDRLSPKNAGPAGVGSHAVATK